MTSYSTHKSEQNRWTVHLVRRHLEFDMMLVTSVAAPDYTDAGAAGSFLEDCRCDRIDHSVPVWYI